MEVIEELIKLAKEMDAATKRGEDLGLTDDEVAFYPELRSRRCAQCSGAGSARRWRAVFGGSPKTSFHSLFCAEKKVRTGTRGFGRAAQTSTRAACAPHSHFGIRVYDALAVNESAVKAMGDDKLKLIAAELITQVRKSVTIDWTLREGARAKIRAMVKRILNKYGYPPDLQEEAVKTVLQQTELLCADWAR